MVGERIRRVRVYEELVKRIEAQIIDGRLRPGDVLPSEREIMELYGVGRPAVREAILSLQKAGLLIVQNGERARVCAPSAETMIGELGSSARYLLSQPDGVKQFQQARRFLEVSLVRYAAENATSDDLFKLEQALAENERTLHDMEAFAATDIAFHYVLAELPGNAIFVALHRGIAEWLNEQRSISLSSQGAAVDALACHREIFLAIKAGNADRAETAMLLHLDHVREFYWRGRGN